MSTTNHHCTLELDSDSILARGPNVWPKTSRGFKKLTQISQYHPETYDYFYSYPAVMAERQRHLLEASSCLIHPLSIFSLYWKSMMIVINIVHMVTSTLRLCYVVEPVDRLKHHELDYLLLCIDAVCLCDIVFNFLTGFLKKKEINDIENIVMERYKIIWHYLRRWCIVDLLSCLPVSFFLLLFYPLKYRCILVAHILAILRTARICSVTKDLKIIMKTFTRSYIWIGVVRHILVFILSAHWCSCVLYLPVIMSLYWYGEIPPQYTGFLKHPDDILKLSMSYRYTKSIFISLSGFFATGFSMFHSKQSIEALLHALIILYSALFVVYNFVFLLKIYMTMHSSTLRYHELMNQIEEYMKTKQFPVTLKRRVRAFYNYRYQERYFSEDSVLESLSEELRNEITLHTCYKLVNKVALFKDVPATAVGSVLGCLHPEVYLPNDSVLHAGDIGDCMYFIAHGTVAVYSLKGVEVCHLEDGAHFGEVALLMKDKKRVATVVAVEITELYRLDAYDFKQFIFTNEILYHRIEALASQRMHETVLLDEEFRRGWERSHE